MKNPALSRKRNALIIRVGMELGRELGTVSVFLHQAIASKIGLNVTDTRCFELMSRYADEPLTAGHLARATGFNYVRVPGPDGKMDQFAHSSVIMIATPDGRMSKYLFGIDYQPRDVRLAVIEAGNHHIGSVSDLILLYCCSYSPSAGKYTVSILRVMGLAAMGSLFMLVALLYALSRKPKTTATHA